MNEEGRVEIGKVSHIEADQFYLWHTRGDALQEARMLNQMLARYDFTQQSLARHLREEKGVQITQAHISRLLSLLTLEPVFIKMIEDKKMAHSTGIKMAKLPPGNRLAVLDRMKAEGRDRIYLYDVDAEKRRVIITEDLLDLVERYGEGIDEPDVTFAKRWWEGLPPEEQHKVYRAYISAIQTPKLDLSHLSDEKSFLQMIMMRAKGRKVPNEDIVMFLQSSDAFNSIREFLEKEGYEVV